MLRAFILLLMVSVSAPGLEAPNYWLGLYLSQHRLWQLGASRTYAVDWRVEGDKVRASYWNKTLGYGVITWSLGREAK